MNRNKSLLVLLVIFYYVQPGAPALSKAALQQTKTVMKNLCKRNSGVSQNVLNQLKAGVMVEDPKLKCYLHCCLGMMKTMSKDKITVVEAAKQVEALLPGDIRDASLKQLHACKDTVGADACDIAFNFIKCCMKVDPNNMLIPT